MMTISTLIQFQQHHVLIFFILGNALVSNKSAAANARNIKFCFLWWFCRCPWRGAGGSQGNPLLNVWRETVGGSPKRFHINCDRFTRDKRALHMTNWKVMIFNGHCYLGTRNTYYVTTVLCSILCSMNKKLLI